MKKPKRYMQDLYTPVNPSKYVGDVTKIRYMSSWELYLHKFFDNNPNILRWSSECIAIPYIKPTDNKLHRYYPDYWIEYKDQDGNIKQEILELKPKNQIVLPKRPSKYAQLTYAVNQAKWKGCQQFCEKYNITFRVICEDDIFRK